MTTRSAKTSKSTKTGSKTSTTKPRSTKSTTSKAATNKVPAPTTASAKTRASTAKPTVVKETTPQVSGPAMNKRELINAAVERSGAKKKEAKPAIEAALAILGEALAEGRDLNIAPFGKLKVNRSKEMANGRVFITKIRQPLVTPDSDSPKPGDSASVKDAAE